jgi:hypothetical protein
MRIEFYTNTNLIDPLLLDELKVFDSEGILKFFNDPFTFNIGITFDNNNKIIGAGIIRVVNEFKMFIDPELSNIKKAAIIKILLDNAENLKQCNETIVEISKGGDHYIDLLVKHYDFYETSGQVLRLEK